MARNNRTCYTCSTKYHYCPTCRDDIKDPKVYTLFCSEKCQAIFLTLSENGCGKVDAETCKKNLISLNVTGNDKMSDDVREHFNRIMATEIKEEVVEIKEETTDSFYRKKR